VLDMEFLLSVYREVGSGTIVIVAELIYVVEPAVPSTIAVAVDSFLDGLSLECGVVFIARS